MSNDTAFPAFDNPPVIEIPLNFGYITVIDDIDADLTSFRWRTQPRKHKYARRSIKRDGKSVEITMHRLICSRVIGRELEPGELVDHIDGDTFNNRRSNLRLATKAQNTQNQKLLSRNTSGYKGVTWNKSCRKWQAAIEENGKAHYLGVFVTPEAAHEAYKQAALIYHGQFANFGDAS